MSYGNFPSRRFKSVSRSTFWLYKRCECECGHKIWSLRGSLCLILNLTCIFIFLCLIVQISEISSLIDVTLSLAIEFPYLFFDKLHDSVFVRLFVCQMDSNAALMSSAIKIGGRFRPFAREALFRSLKAIVCSNAPVTAVCFCFFSSLAM